MFIISLLQININYICICQIITAMSSPSKDQAPRFHHTNQALGSHHTDQAHGCTSSYHTPSDLAPSIDRQTRRELGCDPDYNSQEDKVTNP